MNIDWWLKPLAVAILSAGCYLTGASVGARQVQAAWDRAEVESIKSAVSAHFEAIAKEVEWAEKLRDAEEREKTLRARCGLPAR